MIISGCSEALFSKISFPASPPDDGEMLIFFCNLTVFSQLEVHPIESERARGISSGKARDRFLAGRRLLRGVLSQWISSPSEEIPIALNSDGKPVLPGYPDLQFSISHAGDRVAVAFAQTAVGIDLEKEREVDVPGLLRRFFGTEQEVVKNRVRDSTEFLRLWTACEAAIKADGRGLAGLLSRTRPEGLPGGGYRMVVDGRAWHTVPFSLDGGYHGAVASGYAPKGIHWCDLRELLG
jgi:4'-phosphopantetheinyl transferase